MKDDSLVLPSPGLDLGACAGPLMSCGNSTPLRPSLVWDRLVVPASRVLDPLLRYSAGTSILAAWTRRA